MNKMKKLTFLLTLLFLIVACNQKSNKMSIHNKTENSNENILSIGEGEDLDCRPHGTNTDTVNGEVYYRVVDKMPQYKNGRKDLIKYILDNCEYPQSAIKDSLEGLVFIQFVINENGSVSNTEVLRGLRSDLENECIRVISKMPKWKPGRQDGKAVKVRYVIQIAFQLNSNLKREISITPNRSNKVKID